MAKLVGSWDLESNDNFDEYMKALGVGMVMRKMGNTIKPTNVFSLDGDKWTMKSLSTFKNTEIHFVLGEEFDETTVDGRKVKTVMTADGDSKLIQAQGGDPASTITRELKDDDTMLVTCECKGVVATRIYKRKK